MVGGYFRSQTKNIATNFVSLIDEVKSSDDLKRERELLSELLELVQKRSFIVDSLEEERVRYLFLCLFTNNVVQ